jgi:hypothetical protein
MITCVITFVVTAMLKIDPDFGKRSVQKTLEDEVE